MGKFPTVADIMQQSPTQIDGVGSIADALTLMRRENIACVVVPRRDRQDEHGMLLITDIAREIVSKNRPIKRTQVYEIMTKPAPSLDATMSVKYAIRHMERFALTHCIVLDGRELAGVVTLKKLTYAYLEAAGTET
jgi:CBS domain-containing protein